MFVVGIEIGKVGIEIDKYQYQIVPFSQRKDVGCLSDNGRILIDRSISPQGKQSIGSEKKEQYANIYLFWEYE